MVPCALVIEARNGKMIWSASRRKIDPVVDPLKPLYQKRGIEAHFADLFESFGPTSTAEHRLPFADCSFDTVLCWEAMEHFNFNPLKFVRELLRVLKPGGMAYITVPNKASFQSIVALISGRSERQLIEQYYTFKDYFSGGKKAFHGFHWREYSLPELTLLFSRAGFATEDCGTFVAFQARSGVSLRNQIARKANVILARIFRRYGTHVFLTARRPS
jgi:SAM-dependent methyltransferase